MARTESITFGVRASLALAKHRPESIIRVLYTKNRRHELGLLLKMAAQYRKPYREVETEDLNKQSKSLHHEGVVVVCEPKLTVPFGRFIKDLTLPCMMVALDRVTNPHNQGAILRSLGWFGGAALLVNDSAINVNTATMRISQGAGEFIPVVRTTNLPKALAELNDLGLKTVAAHQRAQQGMRFAHQKNVCFVMGNEGEGLSAEVLKACTDRIAIPGTGEVESLNVSVAAGILMAFSAQQ